MFIVDALFNGSFPNGEPVGWVRRTCNKPKLPRRFLCAITQRGILTYRRMLGYAPPNHHKKPKAQDVAGLTQPTHYTLSLRLSDGFCLCIQLCRLLGHPTCARVGGGLGAETAEKPFTTSPLVAIKPFNLTVSPATPRQKGI